MPGLPQTILSTTTPLTYHTTLHSTPPLSQGALIQLRNKHLNNLYTTNKSKVPNMASLKGPGAAQKHDGSGLRVAIVHARWNTTMIEALVGGAKKTLLASGVKEENIVLESVPGSYELPLAVQRIYAASQIQSATSSVAGGVGSLASGIGDLLGEVTLQRTCREAYSQRLPKKNPRA